MQAFRTLAALVAFAAGLQTAQAQTTQDWPNRPVRLIVPFAAGGSTDVAARLVGDYSRARRASSSMWRTVPAPTA